MTHPDSETELEVDADQVAVYETQGWTTKAGARRASKKGGTTPRTTTQKEEA
jgi:hypothetical protein